MRDIDVDAHRIRGDDRVERNRRTIAHERAAFDRTGRDRAGKRRKPVGEIYPAPPFLRGCRLAGVPVLINSDAHVPEDVGRDFDRAAAVARDAGYGETAAFAQRSRTMVPL